MMSETDIIVSWGISRYRLVIVPDFERKAFLTFSAYQRWRNFKYGSKEWFVALSRQIEDCGLEQAINVRRRRRRPN
jgi:hypothetical protein